MYSKSEETEWMSSNTSLGGIGYYSLKKVKDKDKTKDKQKRITKTKSWSQDDLTKMSEGRKAVIQLLDDRKLEMTIQPKLLACELLDMVASHFSLKEKEYFGLAYHDETQHLHWLQLDRRVLEHEFPKKPGALTLQFAVRFFIESVSYLRENVTIELFFLQAKHSIHKGGLDCDSDVVFELGAYLLQAHCGDFKDEETTRRYLKKLSILPTHVLKEHPSISYCEARVIDYYTKFSGLSRGAAIINYMNIAESQPTYGIHYYEVKDKSGLPWWLGISYKGISLFDYTDKRTPRRVFAWKQLENLYFRDKKFSIEVHDPKRVVHTLSSVTLYQDALHEPRDTYDELSNAIADPTTQVSVSRRTFGPGNINVHAWFASTQNLTKCIWSMAVSQHQFYLDRKQSKSQLGPQRSLNEIAQDLSQSTASLLSSEEEHFRRSESVGSLSLHSSRTELTPEALEAAQQARQDMAEAFKHKRSSLMELLHRKEEELKSLCLKEMELTGQLPAEWPADQPKPVKTEFEISLKVINRPIKNSSDVLGQLELEYEIQRQIVEAALRLAKDQTVAKSVRRKRKQAHQKANQKLKDIEKKLNDHRRHVGKAPMTRDPHSADDNELLSPSSIPQSPHQGRGLPRNRSAGQLRNTNNTGSRVDQEHFANHLADLRIRPSTPSSHSQGSSSQRSASPTSLHRYQYQPAHPSPSPNRRNMYVSTATGPPTGPPRPPGRTTTMPNMCGHGAPPYPPLPQLPYQAYTLPPPNAVQDPNNLYNLSKQQVCRYDSRDELEGEGSEGRGMVRAGSFESSSSSGGYHTYGHHRAPPHHPAGVGQVPFAVGHLQYEDDQMSLPELEPSKFGSKRESHADRKDSPYYQPPPHTQGSAHDQSSHNSYSHQQRLVRQQAPPPSTPTFNGPPSASIEYTAERPPLHPRHPNTAVQSNFVEYSKPFETADVARYSEKRRYKDRYHQNHSSGKPHAPHASGKPNNTEQRFLGTQSPHMPHRTHTPQVVHHQRSRSSSPLPNDAQYPTSQHVPSSLSLTPSSSYSSGYGSTNPLPQGPGQGESYNSSFRSLHTTPHQSLTSIQEDSFASNSFGSFNTSPLARAFSQEMLQCYDAMEQNIHSPVHSSTLV